MKRKNKAIALLLSLILMLSLSSPIFANNGDEIIYSEMEIKDSKILYDRALNGIREDVLDSNTKIENSIKITDSSTNEVIFEELFEEISEEDANNSEVLATTQLLRVSQKTDGTTKKEYATTLITDMEITEDDTGMEVLGVDATYTKTGNALDPSAGLRLFCTIYYESGTYNNTAYVKLNQVTSRYE